MPANVYEENRNSGGTSVHVAAIQMNANAAPTTDRLARVERTGGTTSPWLRETAAQTAQLGMPAVHGIARGHVRIDLPMARCDLIAMAVNAPGLLKYLPQANGMQMSCDSVQECKNINSSGRILARLTQRDGETFTTAIVQMASRQVRELD